MTATARTHKSQKKQIALKQALAFLNLAPAQLRYAEELHGLYQRSTDDTERAEIQEAFLEIVCPDGVADEGQLEAGVNKEAKKRVDVYHKKVGAEIRKRRIVKGYTQSELAIKAGIPQSHISRLEIGRHTPTHVTIKKLAKALNTQPRMLDPGFDS